MRRWLLTSLAAVATCIATLLSSPATASAAPVAHHPPVRVIGDCFHPQVKPQKVIIACGDRGIVFVHLRYRTWNVRSATGRGQLWVNKCSPTCSAGHYARAAVRFTMDRPKRIHHQLRFSRIRVTYIRTGRHGVEYPPVRPVG